MRIQTYSIVAGSEACDARCAYCVSKMTPPNGVELREPEVNWRNFHKATRLAEMSDVTTVMLTGKGEPTLFPKQLSAYLRNLQPYNFPFIELQTNGIRMAEQPERYRPYLKEWYDAGLSTIALSIVDTEPERNREVYSPHKESYIDLPELVNTLHEHQLSVRLSVTMARDYIDSPAGIERLVDFAQEHDVEQLTVRPVRKPEETRDGAAARWVERHALSGEQQRSIASFLATEGHQLMTLPHGAIVYDLHGQNICLTDCLTIEPAGDDLRQFIFFPDGHLRYDWQYEGAILL